MILVVIAAIWILLLALATPVMIYYQGRFSPQARLKRRMVSITGDTAHLQDTGAAETLARRKLIQGKLKELEEHRAKAKRNTLGMLLVQSGLPLTLRGYILLCLMVGAVAFLLLAIMGLSGMTTMIGAGGAGFALPRLFLKMAIRKNQAAFTEHFADALDVLVRGSRSGLPVGECLRIIGRELPDPVGYEFRMLVESQRVGMSLGSALERGLERMPTTELKFFTIVLVIQQQTGGNLAATLDNLSGVLRARKRLRDKIQAMSSEAKASAMIIGSLPFLVGLMLYVVNPIYIGFLFNTSMGNNMLMGGAVWMSIGILVMRGMINFDL